MLLGVVSFQTKDVSNLATYDTVDTRHDNVLDVLQNLTDLTINISLVTSGSVEDPTFELLNHVLLITEYSVSSSDDTIATGK